MPFPFAKTKPSATGGKQPQFAPFRPKAPAPPMRGGSKPPFGKMMADGGAMGAPSPLGGGGPDTSAPPPMPAGAAGGDEAPGMEGTVKPEAVNYHDDAQSCQSCEYMGDDGQCAVLKMQVSPEGGCNAFEAKGGSEEMGGMQPGEDMGGGDQGTSGYQQ